VSPCPIHHADCSGGVLLQSRGLTNSLVSECLATTGWGEATRRIYQNKYTGPKHRLEASKGSGRGGQTQQVGARTQGARQSFKLIGACYLVVATEVRKKGGMTDLAGRNSTRHQPKFSYQQYQLDAKHHLLLISI